MKIAVVNINKSRLHRNSEYHIYTIKGFVEERSSGQITADVIDIFMNDDINTSVGVIMNGGYKIVLFRLHYWNLDYYEKIIEVLPEDHSILGLWGHDSFSHPEEYMKKKIAFIVQDEPELSLYEVAALLKDNENIGQASGVVYKDKTKKTFVYGETRVLDNLDNIPSPYLSGIIDVNPETSVYWEISRGCLFRCDFCVEFSHLSNMRYHSFSYIEKEIAFFRERGVRHLIIGAPVFNLSHQHVKKILSMIKEYLPNAFIEIQIRPDLLSKEEIDTLAEMNVYLNLGVQSFKNKVLENLMTSINVERSLQAIKYINNYSSLSFGIDIIAGLPRTTFNDFLEDIEAAFHLWPVNLAVYPLSMYPGTRIFNRMREFDYKAEHKYPYLALENPNFSRREMEKASEMCTGIESLYNRGRMVSIFTMLSSCLELPCHDIIDKWNKWLRKNNKVADETMEFGELFALIVSYYSYMFDRYQKKKYWLLAMDMLEHNYFVTTALMHQSDDIITYPYQLENLSDESIVGMNQSAFIKKFTYNIEDVSDAGYIDIKRFASEEEKENLYGLIYRLDGAVFTKTVSDADGAFFRHLKEHGQTSVKKLAKKFPDLDILELVSIWCDEGVLYFIQEQE